MTVPAHIPGSAPTKPRLSTWKIVCLSFGALFLLALAPLIPLIGLGWYFNHIEVGGLSPGYVGAVDHDPRLSKVAAEGRPMIDALEKYREQHGVYPKHLKDAGVATDPSGDEVYVERGYSWTYLPSANWETYMLVRKVGWDTSLSYVFNQGAWHWYWDSGDGTEGKYLEL